MANVCCNALTFTSRDVNAIRDLHKYVLANYKDGENASTRSLMSSFCYSLSDCNRYCDRRDYFDWVDEKMSSKGDVFYFCASTVSAWTPNMEYLEKIIMDKYKNKINLYYQSEEEGLELYVYKDDTGHWYPERFKAYYYGCEKDSFSEYFVSYEELVAFLISTFPKAKGLSVFNSPADNEDIICKAYEEGDSEFTFGIYCFKPAVLNNQLIALDDNHLEVA